MKRTCPTMSPLLKREGLIRHPGSSNSVRDIDKRILVRGNLQGAVVSPDSR